MRKRFTLRRLVNYFLGGLLIVLPVAGTAYVFVAGFRFMDGLIDTRSLFGMTIPGIGVVLVIAAITFIGFLGAGFLTKPILDFFDHLLERIPGIKVIYSSLKDFMEAFVGDKKKFNEPVVVEMGNGIYKMGFVTMKDLSHIAMEGYVAVYFPHSYNFSGNVFLVPEGKVKHVTANSSEYMKFIVSGGVMEMGDDSDKKDSKKL